MKSSKLPLRTVEIVSRSALTVCELPLGAYHQNKAAAITSAIAPIAHRIRVGIPRLVTTRSIPLPVTGRMVSVATCSILTTLIALPLTQWVISKRRAIPGKSEGRRRRCNHSSDFGHGCSKPDEKARHAVVAINGTALDSDGGFEAATVMHAVARTAATMHRHWWKKVFNVGLPFGGNADAIDPA
ncbi:MAG TPA: hypothetical protein VF695_00130 [Sphingomonas sp.]|jgi:hypothetical protein